MFQWYMMWDVICDMWYVICVCYPPKQKCFSVSHCFTCGWIPMNPNISKCITKCVSHQKSGINNYGDARSVPAAFQCISYLSLTGVVTEVWLRLRPAERRFSSAHLLQYHWLRTLWALQQETGLRHAYPGPSLASFSIISIHVLSLFPGLLRLTTQGHSQSEVSEMLE